MKFGENLRLIRRNKNMSQEELAEKVKVSRQSVSKWETGDAYPEMNNILQLCKIFNCNINDLVHTDMSDIASLDKEIVMNVVKFNEKKQNQVKVLCNIIGLIGKIGAIVLKVAIPFIVIVMAIIPYLVNNIEVSDDKITFINDNIKIVDGDTLEIYDVAVADVDEDIINNEIVDLFSENSKMKIILFSESAVIFLLIEIILSIYILGFIEKLFFNIKDNKTPFTLENVSYIKKISYFIIALIIISPVSGLLLNSLVGLPFEDSAFELLNILEILIIFSMSYIFEYGFEIQKDSTGIMYDEVK